MPAKPKTRKRVPSNNKSRGVVASSITLIPAKPKNDVIVPATGEAVIISTRRATSDANQKEGFTREDFGSVWFRNHNPNPISSTNVSGSVSVSSSHTNTINTSTKINSSAASTIVTPALKVPLSQPSSIGRRLPHLPPPPPLHQQTNELSYIPSWARYRLPPAPALPLLGSLPLATVTVTQSATSQSSASPSIASSCVPSASPSPSPEIAIDEEADRDEGIGTVSSSDTSAVVFVPHYSRFPSQLYPYSVEGLSTEMYDFVTSMELTTAEKAARESLKVKIERVVNSLWPLPSSASQVFDSKRCVKTILASFSTPSLESLISSPQTSGTATPIPEDVCDGPADRTQTPVNSSHANCTTAESCEINPMNNILSPNSGAVGGLSASVILFGSYALGLATPSSDLDLSVLFSNHTGTPSERASIPTSPTGGVSTMVAEHGAEELGEEVQVQRFSGTRPPSFEVLRLRELAAALQESDSSIEVKVLEECHVPVAHILDLPTGVSADVSINMSHMRDVVRMQRAWLTEEEQRELREGSCSEECGGRVPDVSKVRALIILTKLALKQWGLGCSFTGGLSSTGVYLLVERFLREGREAGCVSTPLPPLSRLTIEFWSYLSSDMFQHGFLASDIFHISNLNGAVTGNLHSPVSIFASRQGGSVQNAGDNIEGDRFVSSPHNLSPVTADAPSGFPVADESSQRGGVLPGGSTSQSVVSNATASAAAAAILPDVTRRCTRMGELQFLFRHSATTLEQLIAPGSKNTWSLPITPLSAVLADPRLCPQPALHKMLRPVHTVYRPPKTAPREGSESGGPMLSNRSSTPGASSNGSERGGVSPSVKVSSSPVKFTSSLKDFVSAPCFVPKKFSVPPPPEYNQVIV